MQIYRHLAKRKIKKNGGRKIKKRGPPAARSPAGGRQPERIGEERRELRRMRERARKNAREKERKRGWKKSDNSGGCKGGL